MAGVTSRVIPPKPGFYVNESDVDEIRNNAPAMFQNFLNTVVKPYQVDFPKWQ